MNKVREKKTTGINTLSSEKKTTGLRLLEVAKLFLLFLLNLLNKLVILKTI